ncbi:MAG TPA: VWA domain-containing protein [Phycisphaerae bacterium]|nr:VWA domain-containing protein [Phycisphaerae bacterium]HNU43987.1 VWA domain-containing protein [Phycisphaerae bacterium]
MSGQVGVAAEGAGPGSGGPVEASVRHEGSAAPQLTGPGILVTWAVSIALHALVFIVMFLVPWLAATWDTEDELPVALTKLVGQTEATAYVPAPAPDLKPRQQSLELDQTRFDPQRFTGLSELGNVKRPELSIIGIGAGGGDFEDFGLHVGGGQGPEFFGLGGGSAREVRSVVFVVDRSGSMLETFDAVRQELRRSISALRRSQKFHVIFFSQDAVENPPKRLVSAIRAQKEAFFQFLAGVEPGGHTDPTEAMRRAFALEPDLVYFLTDGLFDPSLLPKLDKWNKDRRIRVFTIAYVSREGAELLERIARAHRGEFRFVSEDEISP